MTYCLLCILKYRTSLCGHIKLYLCIFMSSVLQYLSYYKCVAKRLSNLL